MNSEEPRTKPLGAEVTEETAARFAAWCKDRGYLKGRALEAAIMLLRWAPRELAGLAAEGNEAAVRAFFEQAADAFGAGAIDAISRAGQGGGSKQTAPRQRAGGSRGSG